MLQFDHVVNCSRSVCSQRSVSKIDFLYAIRLDTSIILCALILSETLALYKSFTYLLTYVLRQTVVQFVF